MSEQNDSEKEATTNPEAEDEASAVLIQELLVLLAVITLTDTDNRRTDPLMQMASRLVRPTTEDAQALIDGIRGLIHTTRIEILASLRSMPVTDCDCAIDTAIRWSHQPLPADVLRQIEDVPRERYLPAVLAYAEAHKEDDDGHHDQETV